MCMLFVIFTHATTLLLCYMRMHSFSANTKHLFFSVHYSKVKHTLCSCKTYHWLLVSSLSIRLIMLIVLVILLLLELLLMLMLVSLPCCQILLVLLILLHVLLIGSTSRAICCCCVSWSILRPDKPK